MEIQNLSKGCRYDGVIIKHSPEKMYTINKSNDILSVSDIESYSVIQDTENTNEIIFNGNYSTKGLFFYNCTFKNVSINFGRGISNIVFCKSTLRKLNFRESDFIKDLFFIDCLWTARYLRKQPITGNGLNETFENELISKSHIYNIVFMDSVIKKIIKYEKYHYKLKKFTTSQYKLKT